MATLRTLPRAYPSHPLFLSAGVVCRQRLDLITSLALYESVSYCCLLPVPRYLLPSAHLNIYLA